MLILSRKVGEAFIIDGEIKVRVLKDNKGAISLGIDAPKEVRILRKELLDKQGDSPKPSIKKKKSVPEEA